MDKHELLGERPSASDVHSRSVRGGVIAFFARGGAQFIRLMSLLVLARLLAPADFGLMAMVMAAVGIADVFRDLGLSAATVQRAEITHQQINTLFWVNVLFGFLMMLAVMAVAPMLGRFYSDPRIQNITYALACSFLLAGLGTQHMALLRRGLRFKELAYINLTSMVFGNLAAVVLAALGMHHWSIVLGSLVTSFASTGLAWHYSAWRPQRPAYDPTVKPMLRFGGALTLFTLMSYIGQNLPSLIIGRSWNATAVGVYNRGYLLLSSLTSFALEPLNLIVPAALARFGDDERAFREYYLHSLTITTLLVMPVSLLCVGMPEDIVRVLLGAQWGETAPLLRLMAMGTLPQALCFTTGWIYLARGDSRRMTHWGAFGWTFLIVCLLAGARFGLEGIATAYAASMALLLIPCLLYAFGGTTLTLVGVWQACWRPVAAALLTWVVVMLLWMLLHDRSAALRLGVCTTVFGLLDVGLLITVFQQRQTLLALIAQLRSRSTAPAVSRHGV